MALRCPFATLALLALVGAGAPTQAAALQAGPGSPTDKRVAVHLQGDVRTVFTQLGDLYGVKIIVDQYLPARSLTLRLPEADLATALRLATELTNAFLVALDDRTILVAANTQEKHRQYEPQVVQTFSLPGSKPEELAETVRLLREVFDMRRIQADARTNTFTVRDTPERVALAAKVLAQLRREPGEVLVEALVLEVDRERARTLGILPPQQSTIVHLGTGFVDLAQAESLINLLRPLLERGVIQRRSSASPCKPCWLGRLLIPACAPSPSRPSFCSAAEQPRLRPSSPARP